jgi:hypothetical protein
MFKRAWRVKLVRQIALRCVFMKQFCVDANVSY